MGGTIAGGKAARDTNRTKYGADYYAKIGAKGGKISRNGGFGAGEAGRELARRAGAKGGRISRKPIRKV